MTLQRFSDYVQSIAAIVVILLFVWGIFTWKAGVDQAVRDSAELKSGVQLIVKGLLEVRKDLSELKNKPAPEVSAQQLVDNWNVTFRANDKVQFEGQMSIRALDSNLIIFEGQQSRRETLLGIEGKGEIRQGVIDFTYVRVTNNKRGQEGHGQFFIKSTMLLSGWVRNPDGEYSTIDAQRLQ